MKNIGKKLKFIIPIIIILIGIAVVIFSLNNGDNKGLDNGNQVEELTTVILSINPKIALEVDKNNNIKNMYPLNSDAEVYDRDSFIGLTLEQSIDKVVKESETFLKKNNKITISVANNDNNDEVKEKVETIIQNVETIIKEKGIETEKKELVETELNEIKERIVEFKKEIEETNKPDKEAENNSDKEENQEPAQEDNKNEENKEPVKEEDKNEEPKQEVVETPKSSNNILKSLSIDKGSINFSGNTTSYSVVVDYAVSKIKVTAVAEDSKAKVNGTGSKTINVGKNKIEVKVTAEDKSVKTYVINVERRAQINLNENKEYWLTTGTPAEQYIYPNNEVCKGKFPTEVDVPAGLTYDEYCKNTPPTSYPELNGTGYKCVAEVMDFGMEGVTVSKLYICEYIKEIASSETVKKAVEKIVKKGNYFGIGGGMGGSEPVTLDEAMCKKYNITCGRW